MPYVYLQMCSMTRKLAVCVPVIHWTRSNETNEANKGSGPRVRQARHQFPRLLLRGRKKEKACFPFFLISFHKSSRPSDVDCRPGNSFHFGNVAITRREFPCSVHWREIYQQRNGFWQPVAREFQSKWGALSVISLYWLLISDSVSFQVERKWHNGWLQVNVLTKR